jgi:hypothetical protein
VYVPSFERRLKAALLFKAKTSGTARFFRNTKRKRTNVSRWHGIKPISASLRDVPFCIFLAEALYHR